ncbi:MAG TPA: metallophosphoesterase [Bacteroidales bacterium]|nr:metallophosphoesterase [Bacteroidales bacterium]
MIKLFSYYLLIIFININNLLYAQQKQILLNHKADSLLKTKNVEKKFSFVVLGDSQRTDTLPLLSEVFSGILTEINNNPIKPKFIIMLGDFVYSGTYNQYDYFYNAISLFMDTTGIAFFCLPGNHNFTGIQGFQNYMNFIDNDLDYYFDYGNKRFILINNVNSLTYNNYNVTQNQIDTISNWLQETKRLKFAFYHLSLVRNIHSSGLSNPGYASLLSTLENGNISVFFNGHIHEYNKTIYDNLYHITTGGAGGPLTGTYSPPNNYNNYHWLMITVDECDGIFLQMYRYQSGNDSISQLYDFHIKEPQYISISSQLTHNKCYGGIDGSISITAEGGITPNTYTYLWSNAANTPTINYLQAGTYTVTVTDSTGCYQTATFNIEEPLPIITQITKQDAKCAGENSGQIMLNVSGGIAPYAYQWSNGSNKQNLDSLYTGIYQVTVSDNNGCTQTDKTIIKEPSPIIIQPTIIPDTNNKCVASIYLNIVGGIPPYNYLWSAPYNNINTSYLLNICNGNYTVTVTDSNGCYNSLTVEINNITQNNYEYNNYQDNIKITIMPNPVKNYIKLLLPYVSDYVEISLFNLTGKIIFNKSIYNSINKEVTITLNNVTGGLYYISIKTIKETIIRKIVIDK